VRLNATKLGHVLLADETIAFLSDLSRWREETDYDVHGIIGMDLLHRQVIEIDYDRGQLRLLSRVPEDPGEKIAFDFLRSGLPVVGVTVGTLNENLFTIDTGCLPNGFVDKSLFARLQRQHELSNVEPSFHNDSAPWTSTAARFPGLQLGPFQHESLKMASAVGSALGNRYLSRYRAVFDFPGRTIYLKKGSRYSEPDRDDASGLAVIRQNGEFVVDTVDPISCASQAGIRKGDIVLRIENEDVKEMSLFQLREVFKEAGRALNVVVRRENREIESVMHLKDYVAERLARKASALESSSEP
jgi:hypothetical protein